MWQNPVKELLKKGQPAAGIVISVNNVDHGRRRGPTA